MLNQQNTDQLRALKLTGMLRPGSSSASSHRPTT